MKPPPFDDVAHAALIAALCFVLGVAILAGLVLERCQ